MYLLAPSRFPFFYAKFHSEERQDGGAAGIQLISVFLNTQLYAQFSAFSPSCNHDILPWTRQKSGKQEQ
jgi:hypothetical protein